MDASLDALYMQLILQAFTFARYSWEVSDARIYTALSWKEDNQGGIGSMMYSVPHVDGDGQSWSLIR